MAKSLFCCFLLFASLYRLSRCDLKDNFCSRVSSISVMALFGSCLECTCTFFFILQMCFCYLLLVLPFWACCTRLMSFLKSSICSSSLLSHGGICVLFCVWFSFFLSICLSILAPDNLTVATAAVYMVLCNSRKLVTLYFKYSGSISWFTVVTMVASFLEHFCLGIWYLIVGSVPSNSFSAL